MPHLDGRDCAQRPEHEVEVSPAPQRVGNQPDQAERRDEPQPRDQRVGADLALDEQRVQRQPERGEPQGKERSADEVAALATPSPDHQRPSEQDDVEDVGDPQVE